MTTFLKAIFVRTVFQVIAERNGPTHTFDDTEDWAAQKNILPPETGKKNKSFPAMVLGKVGSKMSIDTLTLTNQNRDVSTEDIINCIQVYYPDANPDLIRRADTFAEKAHQNQVRLSGNPYIIHPRNVALLLAELEMDPPSIAAGLLHDVLEDTSITEQDLEKEFGQEIVSLVQGVTKLGKIDLASTEETQMENLRRMLLATAKDLRVVIIKFCDRLHNMRTLKYLPLEKQVSISRSTMDIYAPLAHRMGMGRVKWELEDIGL